MTWFGVRSTEGAPTPKKSPQGDDVPRARRIQQTTAESRHPQGTTLIRGAKLWPTSTPTQSRRATLRRLTAYLIAAAASWTSVGHGREKQHLVCAKPSALTQAENRQRKLDNYTEKSLDPSKTCSGCFYFTPGSGPTACGMCAIFRGPANPQGKCDDWAARPI
jgi:hypothetical protein